MYVSLYVSMYIYVSLNWSKFEYYIRNKLWNISFTILSLINEIWLKSKYGNYSDVSLKQKKKKKRKKKISATYRCVHAYIIHNTHVRTYIHNNHDCLFLFLFIWCCADTSKHIFSRVKRAGFSDKQATLKTTGLLV